MGGASIAALAGTPAAAAINPDSELLARCRKADSIFAGWFNSPDHSDEATDWLSGMETDCFTRMAELPTYTPAGKVVKLRIIVGELDFAKIGARWWIPAARRLYADLPAWTKHRGR